MKSRKLMIAAIAMAMIFAGCKDSETSGRGDDETGKPTMVKISLSQSDNTRTHGGNVTPTDNEKKISTARIYVFGPTKVLEEIIEADISEPNRMSADKVFQSTTGNHYFYAAINIDNSYFASIEKYKTTIDQFEKLILNLANITTATTDDNFWMTGLRSAAPVKLVEASQTEAENGDKNNVEISVGRAVAKIGVDFVPTDQTGGALSQVEYRIRNNPDRMYSIPYIDGTIWKTPYYNSEGTYFESSASFKTAGTSAAHCTDLSYATENSSQSPNRSNSTYVSVKGKFTPSQLYAADGISVIAGDPAGTFWRIAKYDGDPALPASRFLEYGSKYYAAQPDAGQYDAGSEVPVKYTNGICYYGLWIVDNSKTSVTEKYTVKRNTFYWVNIVAVNGAGANTEDGVIVDKNEELEKSTWLEASIKIENWATVTQNSGI